MKVTAPDGTRWKVGRQWWPERGLDHSDASGADVPSGGGGDGSSFDFGDAGDIVAVLVVVAVVILVVLFVTTVVIPVVAFTIELIVLFFAGIAGRVLFRKPWTVRARAEGRTRHHWQIVGFRNSGELRDEVAAALGGGRVLPPPNPPLR